MTDNTTPLDTPTDNSEPDLDAWLAGGERTTELVTLYARNDLYADIQGLERQLSIALEDGSEDESLGGHPEVHSLTHQIDALKAQLVASKREFRVAGRTEEEESVIKDKILAECKEQIDAIAKAGRDKGRDTARRLDVKAVEDVNKIVRAAAAEAVDAFVDRELALRVIAASATNRIGDAWVPVSLPQVRTMYVKLGEGQVSLLSRAASKTKYAAPKVTVPKS